MTQRRRGIFANFFAGFRDGYNRHQQPYGRRQSFVARQDAAYHRNKHRKHAAKNVWYTILGITAFIVVLICICG